MGEIIALKILEGNRITLPKEFIDKAKLKVGDHVGYVFVDKNALKILPVRFVEK